MSGARTGVSLLDPPELRRRLEAGEAVVLLDVREDLERSFCAIPASGPAADLHVPMGQVPARLAEIREAAGDRPVVVYCHLGMRSMVVARWLASHGLDPVFNLEGGIDAWSERADASVPRY